MKRVPTLADVALAQNPLEPTLIASSFREQTRDWLRLAKRFVFDDEAARYLGRMIRQSPRVIADAQDFAIPPYTNMWVELPSWPFLDAIGAPTSGTKLDETSDIRIGYLFNGHRVRVIAESKPGIALMPLEYLIHQPMTAERERALIDALGVSEIKLDFWFWGSSAMQYLGALCANEDPDYADAHEWDRAGLRALRANHSVRTAPTVPGGRSLQDLAADPKSALINGSGGDLRNIVALLLFMNRTANITVLGEVAHGEGFVRKKLRPLLSHRVVKLKLDPLPRLIRLSAGLGVKRRLHDVRGHFCHDRTARGGCPHGAEHEGDFGEWWEEYDVLRWRCSACGGKRWWKHEHKRGESKVGAVQQTYEVTR